MSYKCEKCKKQIKKGIPQCKIVKERTLNMMDGRTRKEISSEKKVCPICDEKAKK